MIKRSLENQCRQLAAQYPVVTITGPRQSGKTTLARACFPEKVYINLEEPDQRALAIDDPRGFLSQFPNGAILDEIQRAPEIPSYLQSIVDEQKKNGLFILTGSQQLEMTQSVSQSLAGRTVLMKLLPFNLHELTELKKPENLDSLLLKGFYPRLHQERLQPTQFFMSYFETYVQRDLRRLSQIDNLHVFEKFVRILASRVGQLLNYSSIANDLGLSQPTIKKWISLLEASFLIFLLPPFYRNVAKRLIKTPKVYFYDVGLVSYLLEIENEKQLRHHPLRGNLFENFLVTEFLKQRFKQVKPSNLCFYRDREGHEVDLVLSHGQKFIPIEIKSAQTPQGDFIKGITFFKEMFAGQVDESYVIYAGTQPHHFKGSKFIPWERCDQIFS